MILSHVRLHSIDRIFYDWGSQVCFWRRFHCSEKRVWRCQTQRKKPKPYLLQTFGMKTHTHTQIRIHAQAQFCYIATWNVSTLHCNVFILCSSHFARSSCRHVVTFACCYAWLLSCCRQVPVGQGRTWSKVFEVMEMVKGKSGLSDYSVTQTTLEEVFLFLTLKSGVFGEDICY